MGIVRRKPTPEDMGLLTQRVREKREEAIQMGTGKEIVTFEEAKAIAVAAVQSKFFTALTSDSQALVKILRGREFGLQPMESLESIYVVNGKTAMMGAVIAAKIKASGKYNYEIKILTDKECILTFTENGKAIGESKFDMADAKAAGLNSQNYQKYPRNMLFNRALTNGARWYTPDVFGGAIYTPDELRNVDTTSEPEPVNGEVIDTQTGEVIEDAPPVLANKKQLQRLGILCAEKLSPKQRMDVHAGISRMLKLQTPITSRTELTSEQIERVIAAFEKMPDYVPAPEEVEAAEAGIDPDLFDRS